MRFSPSHVALAALLLPATLMAQSRSFLPRTTTFPSSTRAMALGDSYVLTAGHSDVIFYHPARVTDASGFGADLQSWGTDGASAASAAAFSGSFEGFGGAWGIGIRMLQFGVPSDGGAGGGVPQAPIGQDHHFVSGGDPVSERTATIAFGRELFGGISLGVAMDLVDARFGASQDNAMLFDAGLSTDVGPVGVALTAHDMGSKPFGDFGTGPSRVVLGAGAYGEQVGILDVGFAANAGIDADDQFTFGAGVEIGYYPIQGRTFVARLGMQDVPDGSSVSPVTAGFAFWADNLSLEWAFRPLGDSLGTGTHRFGVRWR